MARGANRYMSTIAAITGDTILRNAHLPAVAFIRV
jgi:hypothetical protein